MIQKHDGIFSDKALKIILNAASELKPRPVDKNYRKCDLRWVKREQGPMAQGIIDLLITLANKVKDAHGISEELTAEAIQFTSYYEGGEYKMHVDNGGNPDPVTRHRQLSMVVQLNDPEEFMGGGIEFEDYPDVELTKGSIVTFNSHLKHRAKPVLLGTRHVMVCWFFPVNCAYYQERAEGINETAHEQNQKHIDKVIAYFKENKL